MISNIYIFSRLTLAFKFLDWRSAGLMQGVRLSEFKIWPLIFCKEKLKIRKIHEEWKTVAMFLISILQILSRRF